MFNIDELDLALNVVPRFNRNLVILGISDNACWNWNAGKDKDGYGKFTLTDLDGQHIDVRAHRFSYWLRNRSWNDALLVCHTCDNTSCCNPKHLFLGTQLDNVQDAISKDRWNSEKRAQSYLAKAEDYKQRHLDGVGILPSGEERRRRVAEGTWKWPEFDRKGQNNGNAKLTDDQVDELRRLASTKQYKCKELCAMFGIKHSQYYNIINYKQRV